MNKSILFVLHTIGIGGSMTSMLNLLELLKAQGYDIDLFIMEHEGVFLDRAKNAANLLKEDLILAAVICEKSKLLKEKKISKLAVRLVYVAAHKVFGIQRVNTFIYSWRAKKLCKRYRNVVAFQEGMTTDFVRKIKSENKIAWVHSNYEYFTKGKTIDEMQEIYEGYDKIVCVSEISKDSILMNLKNFQNKIIVIYNTINSDYVLRKSEDYEFKSDKSIINFVSAGRFAKAKRFDRIVEVSRRLVDSGFKFRWYIIGDGDLYDDVRQRIKAASMEEIIILKGALANPYPIIKSADYLVITSSSETHPMVANEALILHRPVISTAFPSVFEVISDRKNGLICQNSSNGIFDGLKEIFEDENLRMEINSGAQNFVYSNQGILTQISDLLI